MGQKEGLVPAIAGPGESGGGQAGVLPLAKFFALDVVGHAAAVTHEVRRRAKDKRPLRRGVGPKAQQARERGKV
jgi:hypothetical protein